MLRRRDLLPAPIALLVPRARAQQTTIAPRELVFPRDHGAHRESRVEWWYITGALQGDGGDAAYGWQITFFRFRTGIADVHPSAFAARQLLFAHAAVTDVGERRLRHDERIARAGFGIANAAEDELRVSLRDWSLERDPGSGVYRARASSRAGGFAFDLALTPTQPLLLQGDAGFSRKGPRVEQASHYVSHPQLDTRGSLVLDDRELAVHGAAWLDHEWSDEYLDRAAVGWDWIGMNLDNGAALMAFRIRRPDGSTLWAGGADRARGGEARNFDDPAAVRFTPGRIWRSEATGASYPVQWRIDTPAGAFEVRALVEAQELDSRASTGTVYWEGLAELLDASNGRRVGRGYLEMTGYLGRLRM